MIALCLGTALNTVAEPFIRREKEVPAKDAGAGAAGAEDKGAEDEVVTIIEAMEKVERPGKQKEGCIDDKAESAGSDRRRKHEDDRRDCFVHPEQLNLKPPRSGAPCEQIRIRNVPHCFESNCDAG